MDLMSSRQSPQECMISQRVLAWLIMHSWAFRRLDGKFILGSIQPDLRSACSIEAWRQQKQSPP